MNAVLARVVLGAVLTAYAGGTCQAQQTPALEPRAAAAKKPAVTPAPVLRKQKKLQDKAVPEPVVLPDPPVPVQQIQQLGVTPCVAVVDKMARGALTSKYDVQSGWNRDAPAEHVFQSVAILNRPENKPPDGLTALIATPTANGSCDGVTMQVFPLAGDCESAQKLLQTGGSAPAPILNAKVLFDRAGKRVFLLPGFANTCIAIAVDSTFGEPKPRN